MLRSYVNARRDAGRKLLSFYLTAGYPSPASTVPLILAIAEAGGDFIELGIPFSDPVADGPVIQHSSEVALRNGVTIDTIFDMIAEVRKTSAIPILLMGYCNPLYSYGMEVFFARCRSAHVEGTIIADLPLEESAKYQRLAGQNDVATVFLAAPTTPDLRLRQLDEASSGFLYCVSITGITGERTGLTNQTTEFLTRVRTHTRNNPLLVGFGISTPADACAMAAISDGVIIGSAFITTLRQSSPASMMENATTFVRSFRLALDQRD